MNTATAQLHLDKILDRIGHEQKRLRRREDLRLSAILEDIRRDVELAAEELKGENNESS